MQHENGKISNRNYQHGFICFSTFQSCAAGLGNALADNGEVSGTSGMLLAFCMLIAGIVGVATRKSKGGGIVAGVFYLLGGLLGIVNYGSFSDLAIWSVLCFIFGAVFILGSLKMKKADKSNTDAAE